MQTLYHGTSDACWQKIQNEGLIGSRRNGTFLTNDLDAAEEYGGVILAVEVPDFERQPNGTIAPPFFLDDWHRDSGMPGQAWEYDALIPADKITRVC